MEVAWGGGEEAHLNAYFIFARVLHSIKLHASLHRRKCCSLPGYSCVKPTPGYCDGFMVSVKGSNKTGIY